MKAFCTRTKQNAFLAQKPDHFHGQLFSKTKIIWWRLFVRSNKNSDAKNVTFHFSSELRRIFYMLSTARKFAKIVKLHENSRKFFANIGSDAEGSEKSVSLMKWTIFWCRNMWNNFVETSQPNFTKRWAKTNFINSTHKKYTTTDSQNKRLVHISI